MKREMRRNQKIASDVESKITGVGSVLRRTVSVHGVEKSVILNGLVIAR